MTPAQHARNRGMRTAADHADRVSPGWSEHAYRLARHFLRHTTRSHVTGELIRQYAYKRNLDPAPDDRAWGGVLTRLAREGYLYKNGYAQARSSAAHMRPVTVWEVAA